MRGIVLIGLVLTLCACAAPPSQASRDLAACRRDADRSMGRDAAIDPTDDRTGNPMTMFRRESLRGDYQTLVDQCMGNSSPSP